MLRFKTLVASLCLFSAFAFAADKFPPPARDAKTYAAVDTHPAEKVSVAIDPCTSVSKCPFFRMDYLSLEFVPIRVIITNDGEKTLTLDYVETQFVSQGDVRLPSAEKTEIYRRFYDKNGSSSKAVKNIALDFGLYGIPTRLVPPHSTVSGYLLFDLQGLKEPMRTGVFAMRQIVIFNGKQLTDFQIPISSSPAGAKP